MTEHDNPSAPAGERERLALLVVHGVGRQGRGEMLRQFAAGLRRVAPEIVPRGVGDGAEVRIGGQPVRLQEVYWADLLRDDKAEGAFLLAEFTAMSWFPWFNFRRRAYPAGQYSLRELVPSLLLLPIASLLVFVAYHGANLLSMICDAFREWPPRRAQRPTNLRFRKRVELMSKEARERKSWLDTILDEFAGDVLTYANSKAGVFYREENETPPADHMRRAYRDIMARFDGAVAEARAHGCRRIQIVAHSLGSVIAYHYLTRSEAADGRPAQALDDVEHLYTIGSPLEKFDLFWPGIMPEPAQVPARRLPWDNFVSFFDPVAGVLKRFEHWGGVVNHRLLGGGFLRGHVVYQHSPVFLRRLSRGLCGAELPLIRTRRERLVDWLLLLGETLLAPALLTLILVAGAGFLTVMALLVPYLASWTVRWWLDPAYWQPIYEWAGIFFAGVLAIVFTITPFLRGSDAQRAQARGSDREPLAEAGEGLAGP
jgi:hypothetical protein